MSHADSHGGAALANVAAGEVCTLVSAWAAMDASVRGWSRRRRLGAATHAAEHDEADRGDGGPCRDRTDDIHGVNVALYQLS